MNPHKPPRSPGDAVFRAWCSQASPQSWGCGIRSLVFTSLPAVLGMQYSELGVFASETVEEPRGMGRAALSLALNVSHWEVVGQCFFFPLPPLNLEYSLSS